MELGEKLRLARQEAGLSQRALCGEEITRNMLSQIENGTARPSMKTLQYLAGRLGRPVSFFLEDGLADSPNQLTILAARRCFDEGQWQGVLRQLQDYRVPDEVFDRERDLMWVISCLNLAENAIKEHREPYARELLEMSRISTCYCSRELDRKRLLLLGRLGEQVSASLPSLDEELLLRSAEALKEESYARAQALLEAVQDRTHQWHLRMGLHWFAREDYEQAAMELQQAEQTYEKETVPRLEICFRELGDFKQAYIYACKGRN